LLGLTVHGVQTCFKKQIQTQGHRCCLLSENIRNTRPTPNLIALQAFKLCFEVVFANDFVRFAMDELKKHRTHQCLAEDLKQQMLLAPCG
jgi:hypothetical protein